MEHLIDLLSNPKQVQIVLQSISSYVIYIYPGIISIYWNNFLEAKTTKGTQALIIKSFSISYLYNILLGSILIYEADQIVYNIFLIIVAILFPYIYNKIKYSNMLVKICEIFGIRTCISGVPFELLKDSEEKYTCIKVYLNDGIISYVGYMENYEYEEDKEKYIILTGYKKYIRTNKREKLVINNEAEQYNQKVFIKFSEIKVIEKIAEGIANNKIYNGKLD